MIDRQPRGVRTARIICAITLTALGMAAASVGWAGTATPDINGGTPVNTHGGHLSESYMQGWALLAEAVRQVRGECGERQVAGCENALYACTAPISSAMIFRR